MDTEELVSVADAAELKGVGRHAIYRALREGKLACVTAFGRTLITREALAGYQPAGHGGKRIGQGRPPKEKSSE